MSAKKRKFDAALGISKPLLSEIGLPTSNVSTSAISSIRFKMRSDILTNIAERSSTGILLHTPLANVLCATSIARFVSFTLALATVANFLFVAGFRESNVSPPSASTYSPLINSFASSTTVLLVNKSFVNFIPPNPPLQRLSRFQSQCCLVVVPYQQQNVRVYLCLQIIFLINQMHHWQLLVVQ